MRAFGLRSFSWRLRVNRITLNDLHFVPGKLTGGLTFLAIIYIPRQKKILRKKSEKEKVFLCVGCPMESLPTQSQSANFSPSPNNQTGLPSGQSGQSMPARFHRINQPQMFFWNCYVEAFSLPKPSIFAIFFLQALINVNTRRVLGFVPAIRQLSLWNILSPAGHAEGRPAIEKNMGSYARTIRGLIYDFNMGRCLQIGRSFE